jgi:hypothetical protein
LGNGGGLTTFVREEDGIELVVSRLKARDHVDVRPVSELVVRLELNLEVKFDPSLGPVLGQVHVVSHGEPVFIRDRPVCLV